MSDEVTVTQADREAAADYFEQFESPLHEHPLETLIDAMAAGEVDENPLIQAFARHRIASQQSVPNSVVEAIMDTIAEARVLWTAGKVEGEEQQALIRQHRALPSVKHEAEHIAKRLKQSGQTEAELLREALEPFGNPDILMQLAEDDDEEWAKFRLLVSDYRRAGRALAHLNATQGEGA